MTIARLGIEVESRQVSAADKRLDTFAKTSRRAERAAIATRKATNIMATSMRGLGVAAAGAVAGIATFQTLSRATDLALQFGASLSEASTLIQGTQEEMEALERSARDLAKTFGGQPKAQVEAFYQAISAGAGGVSEATQILDQANRLAVGGAADLTTSVDLLSGVLNSYGDKAGAVSDISDTLFVGVKTGVTNISQLGATIGNVIPLANAMGVSFEETVATVSALTTQSLTTGKAVTGLQAALTAISGPTKQASDTASALGLEFNAQALEAKGLKGFIDSVIAATGGSATAMRALFGSVEATTAMLALAGGGSEKLTDILGEMENKTGAAATAFDKMAQDELFRWNVVIAQARDGLLTLGQALVGVLLPIMESLADHFNLIAGVAIALSTVLVGRLAVAFARTLVASVMTAVTQLVALEIALGATSRASAIAAASTKLLTRGLFLLRGAIIATGIGALVVGAGLLIGKFLDLVDASGSVGGALKVMGDVASDVFDRMKSGFQSVGLSVKALGKNMVAWFSESLAEMGRALSDWINKVRGPLAGLMAWLSGGKRSKASFLAEMGFVEIGASLNKVGLEARGAALEAEAMADGLWQSATRPLESLKALNKLIEDNKERTETATETVVDFGKTSKDIKKVKKATDEFADALEDLRERQVETLADAWGAFVVGGLKDFKGFARSVLDSFKNMLAQMISMAAKNQISIALGLGGSGGTTASALAQTIGGGATGTGSLASAAAGGGNAGGMLGTAAAFAGTLGAAFSGGLATTMAGVSVGFASGGIGAAITGGLGAAAGGISGALAGGLSMAGLASAIGAAIPVIGAIIAVVMIGKKLFGRKLKDTGIQGTFDFLEGLEASTYKFYKGGWFRSNKTTYSALDEATRRPIDDAFRAVADNVVRATETLGHDKSIFNGFDFDFRFSTRGLSQEKIQEKFKELATDVANGMSDMVVGLESFSQYGEGSYDTLNRLANSLLRVNDVFTDLGYTLFNTSLAGGAAASEFASLFGSLEKFSSSTASYYSRFYTAQEQLGNSTRRVTDALKAIGVDVLPNSLMSYRTLVDDAMAAGNDELAASLIQLSGVFAQLKDATNGVAQATAALNQQQNIFESRQQLLFAQSGILGGYTHKAEPVDRGDPETKSLLRDIVEHVKLGNYNISRNTSKTAQVLERIDLERRGVTLAGSV